MQQHIKEAIRPILYSTGSEDYPYSYGGSLFVVNVMGRCYGLTCRHVIGTKGVDHLLVMPSHVPERGMRPARVNGVSFFKGGENDLQDVAVIQFWPDATPEFFGGTAYAIGPCTVGSSEPAHRLMVYGFLSERTVIDYAAGSITGGYGDLQFTNVGPTSSDQFLRQAVATYAGHNLKSLDGMSGAPVFDLKYGRLCGMVTRAGLQESGVATIWYVDISYVVKVLHKVHNRLPKLIF